MRARRCREPNINCSGEGPDRCGLYNDFQKEKKNCIRDRNIGWFYGMTTFVRLLNANLCFASNSMVSSN